MVPRRQRRRRCVAGILYALSTALAACARAPAEPTTRVQLGEAHLVAAIADGGTAERGASIGHARPDAAVWQSMRRRDIESMSRRFGSGGLIPLPVRPIPAPADVVRAAPDSVRVASGARYVVLAHGSAGEHHPWDDVELRFTVWNRQGMVTTSRAFGSEDSVSYAAEELPHEWADALGLLGEGDRARLWYTLGEPAEPYLADVTMLKVHARPEPPPVPPDVTGPPPSARRADDGTAYVILERGSGGRSASDDDQASLVVTGWTNAGVRFYSSRGTSLVLPLAQLPVGWRDAMKRMTDGGRARLWIPADVGRVRLETRIPRWPVDGTAVIDVDVVRVMGS